MSLATVCTRALILSLIPLFGGCSHTPADATPEGAIRVWIEKMESASDDPSKMREAYELLGPHARANLKERADRASRGQGRRFAPYEMLAEGRFGLAFRPKSMKARIANDEARVEVRGESPDERAEVHCVRESGSWHIEPELPAVPLPAHRGDP
jgi:hypothetical protein